jgi:hypothetical protein
LITNVLGAERMTDFHLFFSCHYVHAIWFASPLGLRVKGLIDHEIDEVEDAL